MKRFAESDSGIAKSDIVMPFNVEVGFPYCRIINLRLG